MQFQGYTCKRSAPKGHYAEFWAEFKTNDGQGHHFDRHRIERMISGGSPHREQLEFALEHWPAMSE